MTRNILESDEVDSKIFAGRVMTLLGDIIEEQKYFRKLLEDSLYLPPSDSPAANQIRQDQEPEYDEIDEGDIDE